ncbi:MAG: uroporphyrinogen-III C-methyltransferase [Gammaproteobacteria bacterium]|jgi:uroporphyrin-3 C-methyltransferase/uroporphyrinogen III methyltransferase/synthase|nr:uroporphyrinogen-III C-methyltransferase [Gammaproteobacteria bacterium]
MGNSVAEVTENQEREAEAETDTKTANSSEKVHRSRSGFWLAVIVFLVILSIVGIGLFLFAQLRQQQETLGGEVSKGDMQLFELTKQISGYQTQIAAIQSHLTTIESDLKAKDRLINESLTEFSQLQSEKLEAIRTDLNTRIQQVQRQLGKTRGDWLIADAEYLLSVANQRLQLTGDVETAREALQAADQRLRESGDAAAYKVREQIAKEIAELGKVQLLDIVGVYSSIRTLETEIGKLSLIKPYSGKPLTPSEEIHDHAQHTDEEHDLLSKALKSLQGVVTVRHTDQPITEIITPEEAQFTRQQLRVKLEMIKIGLVQQNEVLYKASIADAKEWVAENFTSNSIARNFVAELDKLEAISLHSQYPDISHSLKMLRDITKLRIETDKALSAPEPS